MEVQIHGNLFENEIILQHTGLTKTQYQNLPGNSYTSWFDITKGIKSNSNISIKTSKEQKAIACGDILRFVDCCYNSNFTIVIGAWKQNNPTHKVFYEILEFSITPAVRSVICGDLSTENLKPFVDYVKSIPKGKKAQLEHRYLWKEKRQQIYNSISTGLLRIDAKIDSGSQRRVQCSVAIKDMISASIPYTKYDKEYKGIMLPYEQNSPPRSFKKT